MDPDAPEDDWKNQLEDMTGRLVRNSVLSVFIVSSMAVDPGRYLALGEAIAGRGMRVRKIHLPRLTSARASSLHKIMLEVTMEYRSGNCAVISYGASVAPIIAASYYVYSGKSPSLALREAERCFPGLSTRPDDVLMVYSYKKYLNDLNE